MIRETSSDLLERLNAQREEIISYLHSRQRVNGEFPTLRKFGKEVESYVTCTEFKDWYYFGECPFATANIIYHLKYIDDPRIKEILAKGCQSLKLGMENGVARYVPDHHKPFDFPADVDDTCLAVAAMHACGESLEFNRKMILANGDANHDFYTWFVPRPEQEADADISRWLVEDSIIWRERLLGYGIEPESVALREKEYFSASEPAIAANVILGLGVSNETRPYLRRMAQRIGEGNAPLQYYSDALVPYFHAARLYAADPDTEWELRPLRKAALRHIEERQSVDGAVTGAFYSAVAALTLMFFELWDAPALHRLMPYLLGYAEDVARQSGWVPLHYCNDLDGVFQDGGAELTAAFCLDAFVRYAERTHSPRER